MTDKPSTPPTPPPASPTVPAETTYRRSEPEKLRCGVCNGRGFVAWGDQNVKCGACDGTGQVTAD